ncbi:type I methionyl aminopeptidase [Legionella bononiensis]|uniref:Methionine aminopeptidase n=1 Tax=Legionella bononiensis TaxID=2793102 RepID=A0ABS1WBQ7_9GAMM|nr:type I methionyl aminopeptidase [Legionella bononiensis]MBL7481086.1 type I methionyl aminopeptidase [Legionella bononiensis]MBL7526795.1 type I methionyl aminopeptidase [Legionella bononiensis]MBL7564202.1 type I methionyl aminopeptidase [Legionella bononiensis]
MLMKTHDEIQKMRIAGKLAALVLEMIEPYVIAGKSTSELNQLCHQYITEDLEAIPSTLNHYGFPACICTSINHVVCHGIPSDKIIKDGDILNIDVTVKKDGYIGDTSKMFLVGTVKPFAKKLVDVTQECLYKAISIVRPGIRLGDIGHIIQTHAEKNRYSVVREFGGHGIGRTMWEEPHIMHFGKANTGLQLQAGMTFTIEPMINLGSKEVKTLADGWTVVTKDHKLSAQWEHTILVTDNGYEILTLRSDETGINRFNH